MGHVTSWKYDFNKIPGSWFITVIGCYIKMEYQTYFTFIKRTLSTNKTKMYSVIVLYSNDAILIIIIYFFFLFYLFICYSKLLADSRSL